MAWMGLHNIYTMHNLYKQYLYNIDKEIYTQKKKKNIYIYNRAK